MFTKKCYLFIKKKNFEHYNLATILLNKKKYILKKKTPKA